jgi:hypothetical protein
MTKAELLQWLWVIFIIEGDCRASVPFGWLRLKKAWQERRVGFRSVMRAVAKELRLEWARWQQAKAKGEWRDFIAWLAQKGYNANPNEWAEWEKNARSVLSWLEGL